MLPIYINNIRSYSVCLSVCVCMLQPPGFPAVWSDQNPWPFPDLSPWPFYTQFGSQIWLWSLCMIWIIYSYTIITQTDEVPKADFIDLLGIKWQTLVKIYHNWSKTYMLPFCWCTCCCMVFSISFSVLLMSLSACCW